MYFIQETDKPNFWLKTFGIVKLENNKIILPVADLKNMSLKNINKLAIKTDKILKQSNCKKLVLSNKVKENEIYVNELYSKGYDINNGKRLLEAMADKAIEIIVKDKNMKKEETKIQVLVNDITDNIFECIKIMATQYKRVNIVTNHIEKFSKVEEKLLNEKGIMITVTNNKRKSLAKAEIMLNVDFPQELINTYNINDNAVIMNIKQKIKIKKKRFNGININDYEITYSGACNGSDCFENNTQNKFKKAEIYEATIYKKMPFKDIREKLKKDDVKIICLKGERTNIIADA